MFDLYKGKVIAAALLLSAVFTGCQGDVTIDNVGDKISESVNDTIAKTKEQVRDDLKNAIAGEVEDFIANNDLATSLGISPEEQAGINDAIRGYIGNYQADEEQLKAAKESVEELLENARGLSAEEIKNNLADIFEGQEQKEEKKAEE